MGTETPMHRSGCDSANRRRAVGDPTAFGAAS